MSATPVSPDGAHADGEPHGHGDTHNHGSMRTYLIGFALSVVLTAIPFWLVMTDALGDPTATAAAVVIMAVVQVLVHTMCFLHVNTQSEGGWTLLAYLFTGIILLITIAGSLWIMHHLNSNMMPGLMSGQPSSLP